MVSGRDAAPAIRDASRGVSHGDGSLTRAFVKSLARSVRPSRPSRQPTHRKSPPLSLNSLMVGVLAELGHSQIPATVIGTVFGLTGYRHGSLYLEFLPDEAARVHRA
jgi:hypothetical protein